MDFRQEWYTKGYFLDGSGMQKDGFYTRMVYKKDRCSTGVVYKKIDFGREWYTKAWILHGIGIQKDGI